ncbi:uncharacterized protein [Montipora capricornis]|uniref:uncharacterized protein isoform X2 n=1 Tax=Montipora capricornis TaxID=246305 RepID=UPI0035F122D9
MTEERAELSCMQSKICKWSHYIVGVVFAGILFVGLIELITLSKDVEESRRMMKEFSSNLSKIKQENEELRKHLREAEKTLKVITGEQLFNVKDSHVRRARKERVEVERKEHKCHKVNTCLDKYPREQLFNCTTVRRCMPPPARIHVHSLPGGTINSIITSWSTGGAGLRDVQEPYLAEP